MGGALYLIGYSWISTSPNVQVLFINNSATSLGGAIYAQKTGEHDLVSTPNCFIRYLDNIAPPNQQQNVHFKFIDNCASTENGGDAIYTTTVVDCAWNGSFKTVDNATFKQVFLKWLNFEFNYTTNHCSNFIQTSARSFKSSINHLKVAPGETFSFPFEAQNDFGNSTPTTFVIFSDDSKVELPNSFVQTDGSLLFQTNNTNDNYYLQFVTVDRRRHVGYVDVSVENCPLGFYLNNSECICTTEKYDGYSYCSLEIYMQSGYWAGKVGDFFATSIRPFSCCKRSGSVTPVNNNSDILCNNRVGVLCGDCKPGCGISISGRSCVKCYKSHYTAWIIYIATTYIPITIIFVFLLVLNVNLAVGPVHSFIHSLLSDITSHHNGKQSFGLLY